MNNELCCCGVVRESSQVPTGEADRGDVILRMVSLLGCPSLKR